ncbi:hypothetical protein HZ326_2815 [Fusarium oxysporum f. sp. albedinis]|nr:hypothetical protein HZ326_2815 [Fusarium oxysporum f. sp. albedinis]
MEAHLVVGNIYWMAPTTQGLVRTALEEEEYSRPGSPTPFEAGLPSQASITGRHFMRHRLHLLNKARIGVVKASKATLLCFFQCLPAIMSCIMVLPNPGPSVIWMLVPALRASPRWPTLS